MEELTFEMINSRIEKGYTKVDLHKEFMPKLSYGAFCYHTNRIAEKAGKKYVNFHGRKNNFNRDGVFKILDQRNIEKKTMSSLVEEYGVSFSCISNICRGLSYSKYYSDYCEKNGVVKKVEKNNDGKICKTEGCNNNVKPGNWWFCEICERRNKEQVDDDDLFYSVNL